MTQPHPQSVSLVPNAFDKILSAAAVVLFVTVITAIARGSGQWAEIPWPIWFHLATILLAMALTPVMLLRRRGDAKHKLLGKVWLIAMMLTALDSFLISHGHPGSFSVIHILSVWTLFVVPLIWWTARTGRIANHRRAIYGMVLGALLIAGFFTFSPGRVLGEWLLS